MSSVQGDTQQQILKEFRQQVEEEGIIHDGDTVGTDDDTLLWLLSDDVELQCLLTVIYIQPVPSCTQV